MDDSDAPADGEDTPDISSLPDKPIADKPEGDNYDE